MKGLSPVGATDDSSAPGGAVGVRGRSCHHGLAARGTSPIVPDGTDGPTQTAHESANKAYVPRLTPPRCSAAR